MNALFIKNRSLEDAKGTGLPFYSKKEYQYRFQNRRSVMAYGYWNVPNDKLPTFQLWNSNELDTLQLIRVRGKEDVEVIPLDFALLDRHCVTGYNIYTRKDDPLLFNPDCGLYYLRIFNAGDPDLGDFYSAVFEIGGGPFGATISAVLNNLGNFIAGRPVTAQQIINFDYVLTAPIGTGLPVAIPAPYNFSISVIGLPVGGTADLTFTLRTTIGTYVDKYQVTRPVSDFILTKLYA